jgi:hypothetical protein
MTTPKVIFDLFAGDFLTGRYDTYRRICGEEFVYCAGIRLLHADPARGCGVEHQALALRMLLRDRSVLDSELC